jgi:hypothetical protein
MGNPELSKALISRTTDLMSRAHYAILHASMSLKGLGETDDAYTLLVARIVEAILHLSRGKWLYGRATGELADFSLRTAAEADLQGACSSFLLAIETVSDPRAWSTPMKQVAEGGLKHRNELLWFHETPIVPNICPLVILSGSSNDMGRQYVCQCIEIFGSFVFEALAAKELSSADLDHLQAWQERLRDFTPEILEMASGMADGAKLCGVPLTPEKALLLWIGTLAPAREPAPIGVLDAEGGGVMGAYFSKTQPSSSAVQGLAEGLCSGLAAWGGATKDGNLHFSASTDHDCTFQVTIIAYPDEGLPFIYTPFSVNGSIPGVGRFGMAGHPGFNTAGLAYIHHGGGGACAESKAAWGYGVPKGAATFHILRYAGSAQEAQAREEAFPIGDVGHVLGAPGGFYADNTYGFVFESRDPSAPVLRCETFDAAGRPHQFLYATNNVLGEDIRSDVYSPEGGAHWDRVEGWVCPEENHADDTGVLTRHLWSVSAASRNRYLHDAALEKAGAIDFDSVLSVFRKGPGLDTWSWPDAEDAMNAGGTLARPSAAHRLNAFVAAGAPADRTYAAAIGPLTHRSVSPNRPGHGFFIYDETNAYWEVSLTDTIGDMVAAAKRQAKQLANAAQAALARASLPSRTQDRFQKLYREIQTALAQEYPPVIDPKGGDGLLAEAARCLRHYTRAQVRARQILQAFNPPEEWKQD